MEKYEHMPAFNSNDEYCTDFIMVLSDGVLKHINNNGRAYVSIYQFTNDYV